jgi:hypothetical protein
MDFSIFANFNDFTEVAFKIQKGILNWLSAYSRKFGDGQDKYKGFST